MITVIGATEVANELLAQSVRAPIRVRVAVGESANVLKSLVQERVSGAPGPRIITGRYKRSIYVQLRSMSTWYEAEVMTDEPYAHRLEYGFSGVDSRGRYQRSAPYPHWRPAAREIESHFISQIEEAVWQAWL